MLFSKILYSDVEGAPVPSDKFRAARACAALIATLALGLATTGAHAAGLGRLNVQSALGQPLRADVEVPSVGQDEAPTLQVRLAPQAAFRQANLEFNPALTQLRFDLESRPDGSFVVHVTSAQPVNEPFLDLLGVLAAAAVNVQITEYSRAGVVGRFRYRPAQKRRPVGDLFGDGKGYWNIGGGR